jgi:hypothetical protein
MSKNAPAITSREGRGNFIFWKIKMKCALSWQELFVRGEKLQYRDAARAMLPRLAQARTDLGSTESPIRVVFGHAQGDEFSRTWRKFQNLSLRCEGPVPQRRKRSPLLEVAGTGEGSLGGVEFFAGFPGALPILFRGPGFGLQKIEVTRRAGEIGEMADGDEGFVDQALLHLRVAELETKSVVVRIGVERLA